MSTRSAQAAQAAIGAAARELRLPTIRAQASRLPEIAVRERQSYLVFLAELLAAEVDDRAERRRARRITEAKLHSRDRTQASSEPRQLLRPPTTAVSRWGQSSWLQTSGARGLDETQKCLPWW